MTRASFTALTLLGAAVSLIACSAPHAAVETSKAQTFAAADLVDIRDLVPDMTLEIRYASTHNFVGQPIDGYDASKCYLKTAAAKALQSVEAALRPQGFRLKIFDCYRPVRAVGHFVRWAENVQDQRMKSEFYPSLDKSKLLGEYIAPVSGHSRGATLDLTMVKCDASAAHCEALDMGTPFDFFDESAHTDFPGVTADQRANRDRLRDAMTRAGFENYSAEWWHYTFKPEPTPAVQYDIPVK